MSETSKPDAALAMVDGLSQAVAQKRGTDKELMTLFAQLSEAMAGLKNRTEKAELRAKEAEERETKLIADCDALRADNRALTWSNNILSNSIESAMADLRAEDDALRSAIAVFAQVIEPADAVEAPEIGQAQIAA